MSLDYSWAPVIAFCAAGAFWDSRKRRIPNRLTGPAFLGGLIWAVCTRGAYGAGESLIAGILLALPFIVLFVLGCGGAGDAKLMAAIGSWLGLSSGLVVLLCVVLAGGVMGILVALARRKGRTVASNLWDMSLGLIISATYRSRWNEVAVPQPRQMQPMPYGVAIFAGTCIACGVSLWRA